MRVYLVVLLSVVTLTLHAQMQDLLKMSTGELRFTKTLYDESSLWGYFYLYETDNLKDSLKMEYIVLDKNLNKVYNGNFYEKKYPNKGIISYSNYYSNCMFIGNKLVLDIVLKSSTGKIIYNSNRVISLATGDVSEEFIIQSNVFVALPDKLIEGSQRVDSLKNKIIVDPVYGKGKGGFLVRSYNGLFNERQIRFYDENREFKWEYVFDSIPRKKIMSTYMGYKHFEYAFMDSSKMYILENEIYRDELKSVKLVALDLKTGNKTNELCINPDTSLRWHSIRIKALGDTIAIYGKYGFFAFKTMAEAAEGYYRILIDRQCKVLDKKYVKWTDLSTGEFQFRDNGKLKKPNRRMNLATLMMLNDGSMVAANQEYSTRSFLASMVQLFSFFILNFDNPYEKNLFFFNFDKDFKPAGITRVDMTKYYPQYSPVENYHFSQYHNNSSEAMICFFNKTKISGKTETELVINTIKNNTVKTERIPLTSQRKYVIMPYPAKDGYIMLNEYNKKEKYNGVRLERLNN